jgi:hypothetical protein
LQVRALAAAVLLGLGLPAPAQESVAPQSRPVRVPFGVGELLEYDISFGKLHVGNGNMEVLPMDTVRGRSAWHTIFRLNGGLPFYRVRDKFEDWWDVETLASLRFRQDISEGGYKPKRQYEIYPDRREYLEVTEKGAVPMQSVDHPMSETSFIYYLRTIPLRVGMDTSFNDYFMAERNPVRFKVLRKEQVNTGAGRFNAIVVQPIFESKLFSEGGKAEVWLSDDDNRIMLQMKSKVSFGSLNLYLKSYRPSPTTNVPLNRVP